MAIPTDIKSNTKKKNLVRTILIAGGLLVIMVLVLGSVAYRNNPERKYNQAVNRLSELDKTAPRSPLTIQEAGDRLRVLDSESAKSPLTPEQALERLNNVSE